MQDITVSVIVPIYNTGKYLKKCLDSIVSQTLSSIEIILVNDGSTDDCESICRDYLDDERVHYIFKSNEGLAAARQDGIDVAHGEYIGFVDSDDWLDITMYEVMYTTAKQYDADVVYMNRIYGEDGYCMKPEIEPGLYNRDQIEKDLLPRTLAFIGEKGQKVSISPNNCRRIYRKKLLDENHIRFDRRFRRSQDMMLTYEAMLYAQRFYYLGDHYLYHTRQVADSLSRGYTKNMWSLYIPLIERLYFDTEHFPQLNLMPNMHLRAFYYVTDCIENEMKPLCPNDMGTRVANISEIINHPICDRYYGQIPIERMNVLYQKYYELIHKKDAKGIIRYTKIYKSRKRRKTKYFAPVVNFVTESPVIGTLYKRIRHKT